MKFLVTRTSTGDSTITEINTLEELIDFKNKVNEDIIIMDNWFKGIPTDDICCPSTEGKKEAQSCDFMLEIYDDWRE